MGEYIFIFLYVQYVYSNMESTFNTKERKHKADKFVSIT